jgi:transcriptional regulator with XRE-family HTH domain
MKKNTEKDLGFKLKKLRENNGISQQTLAIDLEISQSKVSKIENGTEKITLPYFIKISKYFSLSSDEMVELLEDKKKRQIR